MWPELNVRNRELSISSRDSRWVFFSGRCVYRYLRSSHRLTGSRAYDTSPGRRRWSILLGLKRDRDQQSQQQTPDRHSDALMKTSSNCVFLCVAVFRHESFHRANTECIESVKDFDEPADFL